MYGLYIYIYIYIYVCVCVCVCACVQVCTVCVHVCIYVCMHMHFCACAWFTFICVVSINVPPPQLWGGQHTEMFVDHVTVFSQSVSHIRLSHTILYGWWLLEEGTSRNVPIAGFEMILREDYKSRDEVEGLIFFPKYHFKPQDTGNIPWCSRQQSRHLLYCMATHCLARLRHSSQKFTKLSIFFQRGFPLSCVQCNAYPLYCAPQCNAYPLYCARNKKPVRG